MGYDKSWYGWEFGALTASGTRQHYILGKTLAKKYPNIFKGAYNPFNVYVLSDFTYRCVQSASAQLDGLFEGKGLFLRPNFDPQVAVPPFIDPLVQGTVASISEASALPANRVPTIVNVVDSTNAAIFQRTRGAACPNGGIWERQNTFDKKTKEAWGIFKPTIDKVNANLLPNQQLRGNVDVAIFGDAMLVNLYDNRTLLGGLNDPDLLANFTSAFSWFVFHVEYGQQIQRQLSGYHTIQAMLDQLIAFRQGIKYHQVAMFSGHDYNLYAVLAAFGIVTEECLMENFLSYAANKTTPHPHCVFPHFAANIILELYNQTANPQVKFLYNNMAIPICDGKETCGYEEFLFVARNAIGNNTLASFQEKCGVVNSAGNTNKPAISSEELSAQNQESAAEQLITQDTHLDEEKKINDKTPKATKVISQNTPLKIEVIALIVMTLLCIALLAKIVSNKRAYHVLEEEVKEKRSEVKFHEVVGDVPVLDRQESDAQALCINIKA